MEFIILFLLFYLIPLVSINLNTIMTYINHKRNDQVYSLGFGALQIIVSLLPIGNSVIAYLVAPIEREEVFLISYLKGLNDTLECRSCGIITRRHLLDSFEPKKNWIGNYKYSNSYGTCPHCESNGSMVKEDGFKNHKLPFGKRINYISGIIKYFTLGLNENQRKLKDLKSKQSELEFIDSQMEKWHKLNEQKLKRMEQKVDELKKEMVK